MPPPSATICSSHQPVTVSAGVRADINRHPGVHRSLLQLWSRSSVRDRPTRAAPETTRKHQSLPPSARFSTVKRPLNAPRISPRTGKWSQSDNWRPGCADRAAVSIERLPLSLLCRRGVPLSEPRHVAHYTPSGGPNGARREQRQMRSCTEAPVRNDVDVWQTAVAR